MYQKPQTPLSIGGVLDDGFQLTKAAYGQIFVIALIGSIVGNAPAALLGVDAADPENALGLAGLLFLFVVPLSILFFAWALCRTQGIAEGRPMDLSESLAVALKKFFPALVATILYALIIMLGFLALVVPGIILAMTLLFAPYLVVTDGCGVIESIRRSHNLVWGNWWRTAALFLVVGFVLIVFYALVGAAAVMAEIAGDPADATIVTGVLNWIVIPAIQALYMPVLYCFTVAILNDLKLRREGGDLAARLEATD